MFDTAKKLFDGQPECIQEIIRRFLCNKTAIYEFTALVKENDAHYYNYYESFKHSTNGGILATVGCHRSSINEDVYTFDVEIEDPIEVIRAIIKDQQAIQDKIKKEEAHVKEEQLRDEQKREAFRKLKYHVCQRGV